MVSGGGIGADSVLVMSEAPAVPPVDDKDWTWVITTPCPDCGFDSSSVDRLELPERIRETMRAIMATLQRPDAAQRPAPTVWSPLEYACHVRDVCHMYDMRVGRMLDEDDPLFANWDQDATALEQRYWEQDPAAVAAEGHAAAEIAATRFGRVADVQWNRPGRRSDGAVFTIDTIGRYFLHDLVHHLHDIEH
jgi:hypothetical protein